MNAPDRTAATQAARRPFRIKGLHQLKIGVLEGSRFLARTAYRRSRPLLRALLQALVLLLLLPLAWLLLVFTLLADLVATPFVLLARRTRQRPFERPRTRSASIITVSFDGKHFLEKLIPSLKKTVAECGGRHEIIIVDNGSSDGTVDWLARVHPDVRCVALPENRFFVRGNMAGVQEAEHDILVFVNNDMQVNETFLRDLLDGFTDADVFAVSAQVFFTDQTRRREETGKTRARWKGG
ncbi:MAG: glycosyltransferase, partial [Planctomycetota bacterium]